jgi:hypothetical protein
MVKISGRKYVIRIFPKYLAEGQKLSKMVITREERPKGMNPFQVFHTSSRSTYDQKMESKWLEHLGTFPRK